MALKLHSLPMSTCGARAMFALHEKNVDFELVPVNLTAGEHKQPPFLSKNPFGQIPVLEDGDLTLFESRAITQYVAEKYKEKGTDLIRQNDIKEAALVKVWMEVEAHTFNPVVSPIVYQYFIAPLYGSKTDQSIIDANVEKFKGVLDVYEAKLCKTKYLAGDFYSLADLHHISYLHYFMKTPWSSVVNERSHVKAWWDDITSRPSYTKVAPGLKFGDN